MQEKEVIINLGWPPSTNHYQKWTGRGFALTPKVKSYRNDALVAWLQLGKPKMIGRLSLYIEAFPPDRRKRDLDNTLKNCLDALENAGFYEDDNQVDELHIVRCAVLPPGSLQISIQEIRNG